MRQNRKRNRAVLLVAVFAVIVALLIAAYALSGDDEPEDQTPPTFAAEEQTPVTLFMGYIPSVQFAPAYVAAIKGYFAEEGIAISFENGNENDGLDRIATNNLQFGLISGDQVLLARAQDRPVVYIFEWYHNYPVGIVSAVDLDITEPADLAGRVVSIPGPYGASYMGLRALLNAGELTEDDLGELRSIGYTAADNICEEQVEAAVIYIVNEPIQIRDQCTEVNVIKVSDYTSLVSNGLTTNETTIKNDPDLVRGMVRALQRGVAYTLDNPDEAFELSVANYVIDLADEEKETQRQVLINSLDLWRSDTLGLTNPAAWEATQTLLIEIGLMDEPLDDLTTAYDMSFLPAD
ncbi:MAG: ABC transporter substrate-binding protein [Anaerolineae bacterium]|nr:ABC transporter substrate-binding protein [Anaerolineae bacterium]